MTSSKTLIMESSVTLLQVSLGLKYFSIVSAKKVYKHVKHNLVCALSSEITGRGGVQPPPTHTYIRQKYPYQDRVKGSILSSFYVPIWAGGGGGGQRLLDMMSPKTFFLALSKHISSLVVRDDIQLYVWNCYQIGKSHLCQHFCHSRLIKATVKALQAFWLS